MASPFSTNELFLRSDRIAFGKVPPEVPAREERLLIVPDLQGYSLYFGLSSLVSTNATTGTLEAIYSSNAAFTFDNFNKRLGIGISTPQFGIDIATTTGVRISGGTLIANAFGLQSVPTAALISTLPSYVFAPGTIPPSAISSGSIAGISVPTSALFSTLPTSVFAPSSIPLVALQSSGNIYASSFIGNSFYGDGYNISNIPLANINADITGNFFKPNTIPLSSLASTGQIWIRDGSIITPYLSTSTLETRYLSTQTLITGVIQASSFTTNLLNLTNLSSVMTFTSSLRVGGGLTANTLAGDGLNVTNLNPANLNTVIPSDKFGYRLIAVDAINPFGPFQWIAGPVTFQVGAPVTAQGTLTVNGATTLNTVTANLYSGNGSGLVNLNAVSTPSMNSSIQAAISSFSTALGQVGSGTLSLQNLTSTVGGLGTTGYVSTLSLFSSVYGAISSFSTAFGPGGVSPDNLVSTTGGITTAYITSGYLSTPTLISSTTGLQSNLVSTTGGLVRGYATAGFISSLNLLSTVRGLGSAGYVSSLTLYSTVYGAISSFSTLLGPNNATNMADITSTVAGLGTAGYVSSLTLYSTVYGAISSFSTLLGPNGNTNMTDITSTVTGLGTAGYVSSLSLLSTTGALQGQYLTAGYLSTLSLISTTEGLQSNLVSTTGGLIEIPELTSTVGGITTGYLTAGYLSTLSLISTTEGLQSNLVSTTGGLIEIPELTSTVGGITTGYLTAGYLSTLSLISTTAGLQSSLLSTTTGLETYISSFIDPAELASSVLHFISTVYLTTQLTSTVEGLGTAGYVSTLSLISTTTGLQNNLVSTTGGLIEIPELTSTVGGITAGYLTAGYLSTLSLISTTTGLQNNLVSTTGGLIEVPELTSTVGGITVGYLTAGYLSTLSLISTTTGLQNNLVSTTGGLVEVSELTSTVGGITVGYLTAGYLSTLSLISTTTGLQNNLVSTTGGLIEVPELTSTVGGITVGYLTAGYLSTLSLISTTTGLQNNLVSTTGGLVEVPELTSTVGGITVGYLTAGYISTLSLISTTTGITSNYSSFFSTTLATYNFPYSGEVLYLNYSVSVAPYQQLSINNIVGTNVSNVTSVPGTSVNNFITGFQSDFYLPTFLATGLWTVHLFSQASATGVSVYASLFQRDPVTTVETLIATSSNSPFLVPLTKVSLDLTFDVPYTDITSGNTLVLKIFANNTSGASRNLTTFYENGNYSYVNTTLGTGAVITETFQSTIVGLGTLGYVSTLSLISTTGGLQREFNTAGFLSSPNLLSTTGGLQREFNTAGFISSANLLPFANALGSLGYISSASLRSSLISTTNAMNTAISSFSTALGQVGQGGATTIPASLSTFEIFTSSLLASTMTASNLNAEMITASSITAWNLSSTYVVGDIVLAQTALEVLDGPLIVTNNSGLSPFTAAFGTSNQNVNVTFGINESVKWEQIVRDITGYPMGFVYEQGPEILTLDGKNSHVGIGVKSPQYNLDVSGTLFASSLATLSVALIDINTNQFNFLTTSSGVLQLNGAGITGGGGGAGVSQIVAGSNISVNPPAGTGVVTINATSPGVSDLISTVEGLGTSGYISSGGQGYFSSVTINMLPQTAPLWDSNYIPIAGFDPEPNPLALDIFGSARVLKNLYIGSTTTIIGTQGVATPEISTAQVLTRLVYFVDLVTQTTESLYSANDTLEFNGSNIVMLSNGTPLNFLSTPNLISTTGGLQREFNTAGFLSSPNLLSTVAGLGSINYVSTLSLNSSINAAISSFSTAFGPGGLPIGVLTSTVAGLGQRYLSSIPTVLSTSQFFTSSAVISTGLFNIVSTLVLNASTVTATQMTTSTIATNGISLTANPSWILTSPIQTLAISTNTLWADQGYITTGTLTTGSISTLATNVVTLGAGATWILTSPIQTSVVSSIYMYANLPFFDTVNVGSVSTMNSIEFYGTTGNYNNTVLAEISTGAGTGELLVFKGSSASDRVRIQTTGNFVVETGVSARLFNSNTIQTLANATPAFIVNASSNVGIQMSNPQTALDVAGTGRFVTLSSMALFASSIVAPYTFRPQFFTF